MWRASRAPSRLALQTCGSSPREAAERTAALGAAAAAHAQTHPLSDRATSAASEACSCAPAPGANGHRSLPSSAPGWPHSDRASASLSPWQPAAYLQHVHHLCLTLCLRFPRVSCRVAVYMVSSAGPAYAPVRAPRRIAVAGRAAGSRGPTRGLAPRMRPRSAAACAPSACRRNRAPQRRRHRCRLPTIAWRPDGRRNQATPSTRSE
eukprot:1278033-Prymnesium_polylepis.2